MAGIGKLMKQAQQMQKQMQSVQAQMAEKVIEVSSGGGAIHIKINGQGEFQALTINPDFLKEDVEFVEETLLNSIQEAAKKAKETSEEAMLDITNGLGGGFPGL